jgi:hypothetical protein
VSRNSVSVILGYAWYGVRKVKKLYIQQGGASLMTRWLRENEDGPGNDWLFDILYFGIHSPLSFIVACSMHPRGANDAFGIRCSISVGKGRAKPL